MAGRKPKPTRLKVLAGNPGKRRLNENEPVASGRPEMPRYLDEIAREEWGRVEPLLSEMGVLGRVDSSALAAYCQAYSDWAKAALALQARESLTVLTDKGDEVMAPEVRIGNAALDQMRKFMVELGMTPSARVRLTANVQKPKESNPFAELAGEAAALQ